MAFSTSFPKTRLWSLSGWDQWLTDNRELLSWSLRDITKIFRIPHLFPRQLYLQIITTDTMLSAFFFHGFFAGFPSSFVDRVSWVEYFKRVLVFNRCIFCSLQFRLTLQRMKHPGIKYYTLVLVACENIRFSSLFADGGSEERGETDVFAGYTFSLSFHTYFLVHRRMTQETPKASAFNCYIFKRLTGVVAIESEYLFSFSVKRLDATQFRGWSGKFLFWGSKLWFRKDCWTFWWQITSQRDDNVFLNLWTPVAVGAGKTALRAEANRSEEGTQKRLHFEYPWNLV